MWHFSYHVISTRDAQISPMAEVPRANMGRVLIWHVIWKMPYHNLFIIYRVVTSARSCNKVGHLFWFTFMAQHEANDVILYIHSVHKHRGNSFQRQNYKMRLKQRSLNWINSMQVKKILFTNVFFSWSLCLLNMFPSMVFPKHFYFSGLLT